MDFDALYQGQQVTIGDGPTLEGIPWQLDGPQPLVVELAAAGEFAGPVIECGCGLGDNALFLASQGLAVTAFDASPTAISGNRAKAAARGVDLTFTVADATSLDGIEPGFNSALDSAMMHCLTDDQRRSYLAALHNVCLPDAQLHILCFPQLVGSFFPLPGNTDEASLRRDLSEHWRVDRMEMRHYTTNLSRAQWLSLAPTAPDSAAAFDDHDRLLLPVWQIRATRA